MLLRLSRLNDVHVLSSFLSDLFLFPFSPTLPFFSRRAKFPLKWAHEPAPDTTHNQISYPPLALDGRFVRATCRPGRCIACFVRIRCHINAAPHASSNSRGIRARHSGFPTQPAGARTA